MGIKKKKSVKKKSKSLVDNVFPVGINFSPSKSFANAKKKVSNFYSDYKKNREIEKIKFEKREKIEKKRREVQERKRAKQERLNKLRDEKRKILAQQKMISDNEKQVRKNEEKRRKIEAKRIKIEQHVIY